MNKILTTIAILIVGFLGWFFYEKPIPPFGGEIGAKPSNIYVKNEEIEFKFTDNNNGEDVIIWSNSENYYGWGTTEAFISVKNTSNSDQTFEFIYSSDYSDLISISRFDGSVVSYENVDEFTSVPELFVTATRSYTGYTRVKTGTKSIMKTVDNWTPLSLANYSSKAITISNKLIKKPTATGKQTFSDSIKAGKSKVYKLLTKFSSEGEFFIEAIGDKGSYGHLDPNNWTYEQTFNNETDGDIDDVTGWSVSIADKHNVFTDASAYADPSAVKDIKITTRLGSEDSIATLTVSSVTSGIVYISTKQPVTDGVTQVYLTDGTNVATGIDIRANGQLWWLNEHVWANTGITGLNDGNWHRYGFSFDTDADTIQINIDNQDWLASEGFYQASSGITTFAVHCFSGNGTATPIIYWDFVGPGYTPAPTPVPEVRINPDDFIIIQ